VVEISSQVPGMCRANSWTRKLRISSTKNRSVGCLVILALLGATTTAADVYPETKSSSPAQPSSLQRSMRGNLPNFAKATTMLYRGGQPSERGFHMLAKMGINIVVDLRGSRDTERKIVTHLGMQEMLQSNSRPDIVATVFHSGFEGV
jgi:hypothetical protein